MTIHTPDQLLAYLRRVKRSRAAVTLDAWKPLARELVRRGDAWFDRRGDVLRVKQP